MKTFTIREVAEISGLPDSTLRYYERIGLIHKIARDRSSKQRVYSQGDVDFVAMIACLSATGMSIENMRIYMANRETGSDKAGEQVSILQQRRSQIRHEMHQLELRARYMDAKIAYWEAVAADDPEAKEKCAAATYAVADEMRLPKTSKRNK